MPSLRSLGSAGRLAARVAGGARDDAGTEGSPGAASSGSARVHPAPSPASPLRPSGLAAAFARRGWAPGEAPAPSPGEAPAPAPVPTVAEAPVPGEWDACAPAPAPGAMVLWDDYSNASTVPAPAPGEDDDLKFVSVQSDASRKSLAETVEEALQKAKTGKEKLATVVTGLWLYQHAICGAEDVDSDDEPLIVPPDSESSDEEIEEEGEATCCFGILAVVPEDEREWRLLGGLVEVPEDLREFGADGRVLAIQESNVLLILILALTFADLIVTALATYPQDAPILAGNCPMVERSGDGPTDTGGNPVKGWDYDGDGLCCDESDGFLEPSSCGTGSEYHKKALDVPISNPRPDQVFDQRKQCYQCFNTTVTSRRLATDDRDARRLETCTDDDRTRDVTRSSEGCAWYAKPVNTYRCGDFDDDDFTAAIQCCACGGGSYTPAPTAAPTGAADAMWAGYDEYPEHKLLCTGGPPFSITVGGEAVMYFGQSYVGGIYTNLVTGLEITEMLDASPRNSGPPQMTGINDMTPGCQVQIFGNVVLAIFCVEIFLRLRQFSICRSYLQFFTDPFCILDFSLVAIDLIVLLITLALAGVEEKYPWMKPISDFAKSGRIMRAMRIFRMMRAVRAARAVAKLSANMDIFDAAAAGNLAMIAKKVNSKHVEEDEVDKDDPEYDEEAQLQKQEATDLALKKERDALWKRNDLGETALHVAAARGHERVCKWLLERPSCDSVDPQDWTTGATPLWNACACGKLKAAKVLLAKGADPEACPVFGEYRNVTAKTLALAKHWDQLINETAALRAEEELRVQAKREKRERRRNRFNLAVADRDRRIREKEAARILEIQERQIRAKHRVKTRFESFLREGLRGAWVTWLEAYFDPSEMKARGSSKGKNLAKRAKAARVDFIRLQSDPREVLRRKAVAREARRERRRVRRKNADGRRANNSLRTAWRGDLEQRPPLTEAERVERKARGSAPTNGSSVSRRVHADATSPDRAAKLDRLTAEGFALLAQAQQERDRLAQDTETGPALAIEPEKPEEWDVEKLKTFLKEKGDRSMAGAAKLGRPEDFKKALVGRVRMHLARPTRAAPKRSGREERMERVRRKQLDDDERDAEDKAKEEAEDLAWKNQEEWDETAWLAGYLVGVKAKKDKKWEDAEELERLRKKAYGDAPPSY